MGEKMMMGIKMTKITCVALQEKGQGFQKNSVDGKLGKNPYPIGQYRP